MWEEKQVSKFTESGVVVKVLSLIQMSGFLCGLFMFLVCLVLSVYSGFLHRHVLSCVRLIGVLALHQTGDLSRV